MSTEFDAANSYPVFLRFALYLSPTHRCYLPPSIPFSLFRHIVYGISPFLDSYCIMLPRSLEYLSITLASLILTYMVRLAGCAFFFGRLGCSSITITVTVALNVASGVVAGGRGH